MKSLIYPPTGTDLYYFDNMAFIELKEGHPYSSYDKLILSKGLAESFTDFWPLDANLADIDLYLKRQKTDITVLGKTPGTYRLLPPTQNVQFFLPTHFSIRMRPESSL